MTWSIAARDPDTGAFAVAVATCAFAVGASCPFVRSGVGAVSTQSITNRYLGPAVLDAMARGLPPADAIESALTGDAGRSVRQVHAVDRYGRTAAWTGQTDMRDAIGRLPERLMSAAGLDWSAALPSLSQAHSAMTIGRGPTLAIAREAALKWT